MKPGDIVRVIRIPDQLPEESREAFSLCVGKRFPIAHIEADGRVELLVGHLLGEPDYTHSIYLWPDEIEQENSN